MLISINKYWNTLLNFKILEAVGYQGLTSVFVAESVSDSQLVKPKMCYKRLLSFLILCGVDKPYENEPERAYEVSEQKDDDDKSEYPVSEHHKLLRLHSVSSLWVFIIIFNQSLDPWNVEQRNEFRQSCQPDKLGPHDIREVLKWKCSNEV